jgi:hypothetical protein
MTQNNLPPASGMTPAAVAAPRRAVLGKVALVLTFVPWAAMLTLALVIHPT